jgi:hypothetical protein
LLLADGIATFIFRRRLLGEHLGERRHAGGTHGLAASFSSRAFFYWGGVGCVTLTLWASRAPIYRSLASSQLPAEGRLPLAHFHSLHSVLHAFVRSRSGAQRR